jgi:hypothetical protein
MDRADGELHKAAMALVEAKSVDPNGGALAPTLVELYGQIDPQGCSVTREGRRPGLNTDCRLVHGDICAATRNVIGNYLTFGAANNSRRLRPPDGGPGPRLRIGAAELAKGRGATSW